MSNRDSGAAYLWGIFVVLIFIAITLHRGIDKIAKACVPAPTERGAP